MQRVMEKHEKLKKVKFKPIHGRNVVGFKPDGNIWGCGFLAMGQREKENRPKELLGRIKIRKRLGSTRHIGLFALKRPLNANKLLGRIKIRKRLGSTRHIGLFALKRPLNANKLLLSGHVSPRRFFRIWPEIFAYQIAVWRLYCIIVWTKNLRTVIA